MKSIAVSAAFAAVLATTVSARPAVDERYPYTGPKIPVADWVNPTVNGNGKGFPRLVEPPAVKPKSSHPTNNVNVISLAYVPGGIHIHYQTPFGIGGTPSVKWGESHHSLNQVAHGYSHTCVFYFFDLWKNKKIWRGKTCYTNY
jgi:hypothetical protein